MVDFLTLKNWAIEAGFSKIALCSAECFDEEQIIVSRQKPLTERRQLRFNPCVDYPQAKSIAVMLWPYCEAMEGNEDHLFVDSYYYASNAAYHAARALETRLTNAGCFVKANVSYPAKKAAVRAGLGFIGKNNLLITKEFGTRVVIILLVTDIPAVDSPVADIPKACIQCGRCVSVCPSGALTADGMQYPEKCLRNYMMEGTVIPENLRKTMGMNLIGCDACQRVCPLQRKSNPSVEDAFPLDAFVTSDTSQFAASAARLAQKIGRNAARPQRVRAQAAILAGNSGNSAYLNVLGEWANSEFESVRKHAVWAIDQIEKGNK